MSRAAAFVFGFFIGSLLFFLGAAATWWVQR